MSSAFRAELFSGSQYKRNQGKIARWVTFSAIFCAMALGSWRLFDMFRGYHFVWQYALPFVVLVAGLWFAYRVINWPRFADFLISVEQEMAKVKWPSKDELIKSSIVVLVTLFLLTLTLWVYDLFWNTLLIQWLQIAGQPPVA